MENVATVNTYIFNLPLDDKRNRAAGMYRMGTVLWSFFEKSLVSRLITLTGKTCYWCRQFLTIKNDHVKKLNWSQRTAEITTSKLDT